MLQIVSGWFCCSYSFSFSPRITANQPRSCRALQYFTEHLLDSDSWLNKPEVLESFIAVDEGGDIRRHNKLTEQWLTNEWEHKYIYQSFVVTMSEKITKSVTS